MAASSDSTKASSVAEEIITVVDKKTTERVSVTAEEEGLDRSEPLVDYAGSSEKTDPEEIRLVRKLDFWMLPILWVVNFLNITQRNGISIAPLGGLNKDLGLAGTQFSTALSVSFAAYILGQIPSNLLLTRLRPSAVMSVAMLAGAGITLCMAAVQTFSGLILQRFFVGLVGASVWPGTMFVASSFYKRKELGTRLGVLYTSNILSSAFQGLIAVPIFSNLDGVKGYSAWQWFFIILGSLAGFFSVIAFFTLPDAPENTWWLSTRERQIAHDRMAADTVEKEEDVSMLRGLRQTVTDKYAWLFFFMHHLHTASTSFRNFLPTLFNTLGYSTTITLVLTCPPYLIAAAVTVVVGLSSGKFNERTWHLTGLKLTATAGFILACATLKTAPRLVAAFLFVGWSYAHTSLTIGWLGMTCGQTKEKRAAVIAMANMGASISLIWSPYLWPDTAAPRYTLPLAASAAFCVAGIACAWTIRLCLMADNRRLRRQDENPRLLYAY